MSYRGYIFTEEHRNKISEAKTGIKQTEEHKRKNKESHLGEKNHHWKGGIFKDRGYPLILNVGHPFANSRGYIRIQRLVMEQHIGRYLAPEEQIHHINGIKTDNRIENLMLFATNSEHIKYHHELRRAKNKIIEA